MFYMLIIIVDYCHYLEHPLQVTTESEGLTNKRRVTNTAYFTFVSLGEDLSARPVPPLVLKNEEEKTRFQEGNKRYETKKKIRMDTQTKTQAS